MKTSLTHFILIALSILPTLALSAPDLKLTVSAEVEVIIEENGETRTQLITAEDVQPGQEVIYTLNYINQGEESAFDITLNNQIDLNSTYQLGSAWGDADIQFSVDGGQSFNTASLLVYEFETADGTKQQRQASPDRYTNIRWIIKEIAGGARGQVGFRVTVN